MFYYGMAVFVSTLTLLLADKGLTTVQITYVSSAGAFFTVLVQPIFGILADHSNQKKVTIICLLTILLCGLLLYPIKNCVVLFFINGVCQSLIIITIPLLDFLASQSTFSYNKIRSYGSIGYAVGCQLSGVLYEELSVVSVFMIFGLAMIICVGCILSIRYSGHDKLKNDAQRNSVVSTQNVNWHNGSYLILCVVSFVLVGLHYANIAYMPLLLRHIGDGASVQGTILLLQSLFEIVVVRYCHILTKHFSWRSLLIFTAGVMTLRMFCYGFFPNTFLLIALFFFQGLTVGIFYVISVQMIVETVESPFVNRALALVSMSGKGIGALFFQLLGGLILSQTSFRMMYLALAVIGLFGVLIAAMYPSQSKQLNKGAINVRKVIEK